MSISKEQNYDFSPGSSSVKNTDRPSDFPSTLEDDNNYSADHRNDMGFMNVSENLNNLTADGKLIVSNSNVSRLLRTCSSVKRRLISIEERCIQHLRHCIENSVVIPGAVEIFLFAFNDNVDAFDLIEPMSKFLMKNICYYSKDEKFLEISHCALNTLLDYGRSECEDRNVLIEVLMCWVQHSRDERRKYLNELMLKAVDVTVVSSVKEKFVTDRPQTADASVNTCLTNSHQSTDIGESTRMVTKTESSLHVFVKYPTKKVTKLFCRENNNTGWVLSAVCQYNVDFMRNVAVGSKLYRLDYMNCQHKPQNFTITDSVEVISDYLYLKSPPLILKDFDMCNVSNQIYVLNKQGDWFKNKSFEPELTDELSRSIFTYNCELDKWFSIPVSNYVNMNQACMTTDRHNVLYLIGQRSAKILPQSSLALAYDLRTSKWHELPKPSKFYRGGMCCVHEGKVYLKEYTNEKKLLIVYDPVAGKWQHLEEAKALRVIDSTSFLKNRLISYNNELCVRGNYFTEEDYERSSPSRRVDIYYNSYLSKWSYSSALYTAIKKEDPEINLKYNIQDIVVFQTN